MTEHFNLPETADFEHEREQALASIVEIAQRFNLQPDEISDAVRAASQREQAELSWTTGADEADVPTQDEVATPAEQEVERVPSPWTKMIAKTGPRILIGKFDERMYTGRSNDPRPSRAWFDGITVDQNDAVVRSHEITPDGSAVVRALIKIRDDMNRNQAKGNILLFYRNPPVDERHGDAVHFVYDATMAREADLDDRSGDGNPVRMYGTLPRASLNEFWAKLHETPELIEEVFADTCGPFLDTYIKRKEADFLAMSYMEGIGRGVEAHPSVSNRSVKEILGENNIVYFEKPVGEAPV